MPLTITATEFANLFNLTDDEWSQLVYFTDIRVPGFSIQKKYPDNTMFKIAKNKIGEDDSIPMIWVWLKLEAIKDNKAPVYIKITKQSKYLMSGHYDYNFSEDQSPTKESLLASNKSTQPVDLECSDEYEFDLENKVFYKKNEVVNAHELIDEIYRQHIKTVQIRWAFFRFKMSLRSIWVEKWLIPVDLLKWILKVFFDRDLDRSWRNNFYPNYNKSDLAPLSMDTVSIAWFETNITKKWFKSLCLIYVIISLLNTYFFQIKFNRISWLLDDEIFKWALVVLMVFVYDQWVPLIFFYIIKSYSYLYAYLAKKKISIH